MTEQLKPCPFCGSDPAYHGGPNDNQYGELWWVYCESCCVTHTCEESRAAAAEAWNRRAQPAQAVPTTRDPILRERQQLEQEWSELRRLQAQYKQAVPVLTRDEVDACFDGLMPSGSGKSRYDIAHQIEQAVRAKMGVAVPMPGDQIFRIARRLAPKVIDGMVYVPEWIVPLVRAVEESHGIVGKEGV